MFSAKKFGAMVVAAGVMAACGSASGNSASSTSTSKTTAAGATKGTVTLGLIAPLTGAFAQQGADMQYGAQVAVNEINAKGGAGGYKLKLTVLDDAANAQNATQAARTLLGENVNLVLGAFTTPECDALKDLVPQLGGTYVSTTCVDPTLTGVNGSPGIAGVFRTGLSSNPEIKSQADLPAILSKQIPAISTWDFFSYDYSFGHQEVAAFQASIKAVAPSVNFGLTVYIPLTSQNYRPYVSQLASAATSGNGAHGLFLGTFGAGTGSFLQQADSLNFLSKYKAVYNPGDATDVLTSLNGHFPAIWNMYDYAWSAYDNPQNIAFVKDYRTLAGRLPGGYAAEAYNGVEAYAAAIAKAQSTTSKAVTAALAGISYQALQGTQTIDATTHQADTNRVLSEIEGDPSAPGGMKYLHNIIIRPNGTYYSGATSIPLS